MVGSTQLYDFAAKFLSCSAEKACMGTKHMYGTLQFKETVTYCYQTRNWNISYICAINNLQGDNYSTYFPKAWRSSVCHGTGLSYTSSKG